MAPHQWGSGFCAVSRALLHGQGLQSILLRMLVGLAASAWAGRKIWLRQPNFSVCLETPCPEQKEDLGKAPSLPFLCVSVGSELNLSSLSFTHLLPFLPQHPSPSPFPRCPFARCLPRRPRLVPEEPRGLILGLLSPFCPAPRPRLAAPALTQPPGAAGTMLALMVCSHRWAFRAKPGLKNSRVQLGEAARE